MAPSIKRTPEAVRRLIANIKTDFEVNTKWFHDSVTVKTIRSLKRRINHLEERYRELSALTEELMCLDENEDGTSAQDVTSVYLELIAELETALDVLEDTTNDHRSEASFHSCDNKKRNEVRLPKLDMPEFHGKPEEWPSFYQRFTSAVHGLSDLKKFEYLLTCLKNKSDQGIKNIELLGENYPEVIRILERRYDNKTLNMRRYIQELFKLPVAKENDPESLRQLIDTTTSNIRAIENQGLKRDKLSNELLSILVTTKLDSRTKELYETNHSDESKEDSVKALIEFLEERLRVVSAVFSNPISKSKAVLVTQTTATGAPSHNFNVNNERKVVVRSCPNCSASHALYQCDEFRKLSVPDRYQKVRNLKICVNCFAKGHWASACNSSKCKQCGKNHHTLLHSSNPASAAAAATATALLQKSPVPEVCELKSEPPPTATTAIATSVLKQAARGVLLATAIVNVGKDDLATLATVLLDAGSHITLITSQLAHRLQLPLEPSSLTISGIGATPSSALARTSLQLTSRDLKFSLNAQAYVVPRITDPLPAKNLSMNSDWTFLSEYELADPKFNQRKPIDILLGADLLYEILLPEFHRQRNAPTLQASRFGWVLIGPYTSFSTVLHANCHLTTVKSAELCDINRFWELEEPPSSKNDFSMQDEMCEQLFQDTHTRINGRFSVRLPIFNAILGESYQLARQQLLKCKINDSYREFMNEYEALGHMTRVSSKATGQAKYYIPHHAIYRNGKCRVVFNASCPTSNGSSLNDFSASGPVLQTKVFFVLLRLRTHLYVFTTDVVKMYRQFWVQPSDRIWQHILWIIDEVIVEFELNTVTYGHRSAPYLALRCLLQLATDGKISHPFAAEALKKGSYMDDIEDGEDTVEGAIQHRDELIDLIASAGMELGKWRANDPRLLPPEFTPCVTEPASTLGLLWYTNTDELGVRPPTIATTCTKRSISSQLASIFDPLGILAPVTIVGKLLLQSVWSLKVDWDDFLDREIQCRFEQFTNDIRVATDLRVPRHIFATPPFLFDLHGFADASEKAYAACVYTRVQSGDKFTTHLVCAKTRLAPLQTPRTIPELELCAASLLVQLLEQVAKQLQCPIDRCTLYSDSTIVLAYLAKEPHNWKIFVANRVRHILSVFPRQYWKHVPGDQNPADLATRDSPFSSLQQRHELWFDGPAFLRVPGETTSPPPPPDAIVAILSTHLATIPVQPPLASFEFIFHRISRYDRLQRAVGYVFRFVSILRARVQKQTAPAGVLTFEELNLASNWLLKVAQVSCFSSDLDAIYHHKSLSKQSQLKSLNPFMQQEVLRVGGRLENSALTYNQRHPILLKSSHRLSMLLVRDAHTRYFHAGTRFIRHLLRSKYWFIGNIQRVIERCVHTCARCRRFARFKPEPPLMGNLPTVRVQVSLPFQHVGVDYAGPVYTRSKVRSMRGPTTKIKSYFAIFVCMATKAVHLELVSELTTAAFIATLGRFAARRGFPQSITSDNGTNFVGAEAEIQRNLSKFAQTEEIQNYSATHGFKWNFNPPSASHMGGLYEAVVKSTKHHFRRVVGTQLLTFEEMSTLLTQIEAVLNSRPLTTLNRSDEDIEALTPAHFLIGRSLLLVPGEFTEPLKLSLSDRWRLINQLRNSFWHQWSRDYLRTLQRRYKWQTEVKSFHIGDVVLIADEASAPLLWPLGRITKVYPGTDGIVRVVDVATRGGATLRRPVTKLVPLVPIDEDDPISTPPTTSTAAGC